MVKLVDPGLQRLWREQDQRERRERNREFEVRRYLGIPSFGTFAASPSVIQQYEDVFHESPFQEVLENFLPDSDLQEEQVEGELMPSFAYKGYDVYVTWNSRSEGPRWELGQSGPEKFTFVLYSEERRFVFPLLYGNSPDLLAWLAISYVFSRESGEDREEWWNHLISDLPETE